MVKKDLYNLERRALEVKGEWLIWMGESGPGDTRELEICKTKELVFLDERRRARE